MTAKLIAWTVFDPSSIEEDIEPWEPSTNGIAENAFNGEIMVGGNELAEIAGRLCYASFNRPNPKTATNDGYLANIIDVQHFSVLEHSSATFYFTGVSRSLTHELVRHRHFSYSQRSQRYVNEAQADVIVPEAIQNERSGRARDRFDDAVAQAKQSYEDIMEILLEDWHKDVVGGGTSTKKLKDARGAARSVMPNATETRIVVTGNMRSWREWLQKRGGKGAEIEIRTLAVEVFRIFLGRPDMAPFFSDLHEVKYDDGSLGVSDNEGVWQ